MLQESLEATITRKIGYVLSRAAFTDFKKRVDYSEYGGAPLLGVRASASSAMAGRTRTPSRMPSGWPPNSPSGKINRAHRRRIAPMGAEHVGDFKLLSLLGGLVPAVAQNPNQSMGAHSGPRALPLPVRE